MMCKRVVLHSKTSTQQAVAAELAAMLFTPVLLGQHKWLARVAQRVTEELDRWTHQGRTSDMRGGYSLLNGCAVLPQ